MNSTTVVRFAAIFLAFAVCCESAKILVIFPFASKSHFVMVEHLAKALAGRGHQITVIGHFPQTEPIPNYRDISLEGTTAILVNNMSLQFIQENMGTVLPCLDFIWRDAGVETCKIIYDTPVMKKFLASKEKFDLVISEHWGSDCFLPLANLLDAPHISVLTTMELPWSLARYGGFVNPSYHVSHYLSIPPGRLTLSERLINTVFHIYAYLGHYFISELPSHQVARKFLGSSLPHLSEVVKNSSLLFLNAHFSMLGSRPLPANVIEVGGLHIQPVKPLPSDFKTLLDGAKGGAIIFSLGSLIRSDSLDGRIIDVFVEEIRRLPQIVIWKYNGTVPNRPKNLIVSKWLPQRDVLAHPNVKLFITHGGLMGTQEAIAAGVPMLGIPFFADQRFNLVNYQDKGIAIKLEYEEITPESFRKAIHDLLHDPRYAKNAKRYSELFSDRPMSAQETAIYWTEYVIRHKGTTHMKSSGSELSFIEFHLMDVSAVLLSGLLLVLCLLRLIYRVLIADRFKANKPKKD